MLRVLGVKPVVPERRLELRDELDTLAAGGCSLVTSFVVDDNVDLVLRRTDERTATG